VLVTRDFDYDVILLGELRPRSAPREDTTLDFDQNPGRKNYRLAYRSVRANRDTTLKNLAQPPLG